MLSAVYVCMQPWEVEVNSHQKHQFLSTVDIEPNEPLRMLNNSTTHTHTYTYTYEFSSSSNVFV